VGGTVEEGPSLDFSWFKLVRLRFFVFQKASHLIPKQARTLTSWSGSSVDSDSRSMRHSRQMLCRSRTMDPNACLKRSFSCFSFSVVVLGSMLVLLSEGCVFHVVLMDKTLEGEEEQVVQDPSEHAMPHNSGFAKLDKVEASVTWSVGFSLCSAGVALGSLGTALGSLGFPTDCMGSDSVSI
jgi:hypothetical protein